MDYSSRSFHNPILIGTGGLGAKAISRIKKRRETPSQKERILFTASREKDPRQIQNGVMCSIIDKDIPASMDPDKIAQSMQDRDPVFLIGGLGGETGTEWICRSASISASSGHFTAAFVTLPFAFEGKAVHQKACAGLKRLSGLVDTLFVFPQDSMADLPDSGGDLSDDLEHNLDRFVAGIQNLVDLLVTPFIMIDIFILFEEMTGKAGFYLSTRATGIEADKSIGIDLKKQLDRANVPPEAVERFLIGITMSQEFLLIRMNDVLHAIFAFVDRDLTYFHCTVDPDFEPDWITVTLFILFDIERTGEFIVKTPSFRDCVQ